MGKIISPECGATMGETKEGADVKSGVSCGFCQSSPKFESKIAKMNKVYNEALKCPDCQKAGFHVADGEIAWSKSCPKHKAEYDAIQEIAPEIIEKCKAYRKTLKLPADMDITTQDKAKCDHYRDCYKNCPVPEERDKISPPRKRKYTCKECGTGFDYKSHGKELCDPCYYKTNPIKDGIIGVNRSVFEPIEPPQKKKAISQETKDFLHLQERVISKLNRHPEIYKILDDLFYTDILERLLGKTIGKVSEVVPAHLGGDMTVEPSKKTKKMFESLEKQFAAEDEKTGKKPYNITQQDLQGVASLVRSGVKVNIVESKGDSDDDRWTYTPKEPYPFDDTKANAKICKQHRKTNNCNPFFDYHQVECCYCLAQKKDCPLWKQKEEKNND